MTHRGRNAALVAVLALVAGILRPAFADSLSDVGNAMQSALAGVKSYQLQVASSTPGLTSTSTIVRNPLQVHVQAGNVESYVDRGFLYRNAANRGWRRVRLLAPQAPGDMGRMMQSATQVLLGDDVTEDGMTYGTIVIQTSTAWIPNASAIGPTTLTCSYDKSTFLPHDCKNDFVTMTFVNYNDPANVISLPPAAGASKNLAAGTLPAGDVRSAMEAATKRLGSFQMQLSNRRLRLTSLSTVVTHPLRAHTVVVTGLAQLDLYVDSSYVYLNVNGSGWHKAKTTTPQTPGDITRMFRDATQFTLGADVTASGATFGTFKVHTNTSIDGVPGRGSTTITCTYDKRTFLPQVCRNDEITMTFLRYDDPRNAVSFPAALSSATVLPASIAP